MTVFRAEDLEFDPERDVRSIEQHEHAERSLVWPVSSGSAARMPSMPGMSEPVTLRKTNIEPRCDDCARAVPAAARLTRGTPLRSVPRLAFDPNPFAGAVFAEEQDRDEDEWIEEPQLKYDDRQRQQDPNVDTFHCGAVPCRFPSAQRLDITGEFPNDVFVRRVPVPAPIEEGLPITGAVRVTVSVRRGPGLIPATEPLTHMLYEVLGVDYAALLVLADCGGLPLNRRAADPFANIPFLKTVVPAVRIPVNTSSPLRPFEFYQYLPSPADTGYVSYHSLVVRLRFPDLFAPIAAGTIFAIVSVDDGTAGMPDGPTPCDGDPTDLVYEQFWGRPRLAF